MEVRSALAQAAWWVCGAVAIVLLLRGWLLTRYGHRGDGSTAGTVMEPLAGVYGLLLAFLVGGVANRVIELRAGLREEYDALDRIHLLSQHLPAAIGSDVQNTLKAYAQTEAAVRQGHMNPSRSASILNNAWLSVVLFQPADERQRLLQGEALQELNTLRVQRRVAAKALRPAYNIFIWSVLLVGAFSIIAVCAISSLGDPRASFYLGALTAVITTTLVVLYMLSRPITNPAFRTAVLSHIQR